MVPRVNVLVTLICQQVVEGGGSADMSMSAMGMLRRHEIPPGHTMPGATDMGGQNATEVDGSTAVSSSDGTCSSPEVLASVAFLSTYRDLVTGIIGAVMSFYLGRLSDRIGRVKVLLLNGVGILASELVLLLVVAFPQTLDYRWLFLSFAIDGLSGSFPLLMATAASYVTDTSTDKERIVAMGWIQSGMFFGMAVGPALGSALGSIGGSSEDPSSIFTYAMLCRIIALACLSFLPESLPQSVVGEPKDSGSDMHSSSPWAMLSNPLGLVDALFDADGRPAETRRSRRNLILLMAVNAIMFGSSIGAMDVMMLYPQSQFGWGMMDTGNFISVINIFRTLSTTLVLRLLMHLFTKVTSKKTLATGGGEEEGEEGDKEGVISGAHLILLRVALGFDVLGYVGFGLAPTGLFFVLGGVLTAFSAMGISASQASMSMMVSGEHVGKLMGVLGSLQALARLVSPPAINLVYAWTVSFLPQGVFFGLAGAVAVGILLTHLIRHGR